MDTGQDKRSGGPEPRNITKSVKITKQEELAIYLIAKDERTSDSDVIRKYGVDRAVEMAREQWSRLGLPHAH